MSNAVAILILGEAPEIYVKSPAAFSDSAIRALLDDGTDRTARLASVVSLTGADIPELARLHGSAISSDVTRVGDAPTDRPD